MGTRFVASAESGNHPSYKQKITEAKFSDLVETTLFDGGWPECPHRVIRNSTLTRWEKAGRPASGARPGEGERIGTFPNGPPMLRYNVSTPWDSMKAIGRLGPITQVLPLAWSAKWSRSRIEADAEATLKRVQPT
jgi:nitronate monooxygenase